MSKRLIHRSKRPQRPVEKREIAIAFYAGRDVDVSCQPAMWHINKVSHLINIDLERICRDHGMSLADMHLLAAVRVERAEPMTATELAQLLNVSNAVLSTRLTRLEEKGWLQRTPNPDDRRIIRLQMTTAGISVIDATVEDVGRRANFARHYHRLSEADKEHLVRIMGELHNQLDRDFISVNR
jgi:DNA-binding MarR family transcriptional regulator